MKLILSTIIGGVVFFILGWILYGAIFMDFFAKHYGPIMRTPDDYKLWAIIVGGFVECFFLALIYPKGYSGGSPAKEGFMFGLLMGLLFSVPYVFFMWASHPVTYSAVIVDAIIMFVMTLIVAIVIGLVYGKIEKPASTTP
jgi:hypothetical protein